MPDAITGGGALSCLDVKDAIASFAIDLTDFLLDVSFLGTDIHLDLPGGGNPAGTGRRLVVHTGHPLSINGGGGTTFAGHKNAEGSFDLTGAGGLWGPFPWVINPTVTILNPGLPNSDGSVGRVVKVTNPGGSSSDRTGRIALIGGPSVDDLTTTRTGS